MSQLNALQIDDIEMQENSQNDSQNIEIENKSLALLKQSFGLN